MSETFAPYRIDFPAYRGAPGVNRSALVHILKSPLHYQTKLAEPEKPPLDCQLVGQLVHCFMLEPELYSEKFTVLPAFHLDDENITASGRPSKSKATNYYESCVAQWRAEHSDKLEVSRFQVEDARRAADGAMRHLPELFSREQTLTEHIGGVLCKGRLDILTGVPAIWDIKTVDNCAPRPFFTLAHKNRWPFQMAFYRELVRSSFGVQDVPCYWIAVEVPKRTKDGVVSSCDFDSVLYDIPEALLDQSQREVEMALARYRDCKERRRWPGVDGGERSVELPVPNWAMWESDDVVEVYQGD